MAKILLCTYSHYGSFFTLRLQQEGNDVDIYFNGPRECSGALEGIIKPALQSKPNFKDYDLVLFDLTGKPEEAEECIKLGVPCIGDGDFNTEIEDNRLLGIEIMEQCGIGVPEYETFNDISEAKRFIKKTNKRYVFKPNGGQEQDTATTYAAKTAEDLLQYLDKLGSLAKGAEFILQEFVEGTEISTEAYFNGNDFYLINATLEEKKLMNDNIGPNTGCSGNLVWVYDEMNEPYIFREGLGKMKDFLQQYKYHGMIDLNTIVTDTKLYGLEWTPRFGYDASATLFNIISSNLGEFLWAVASGGEVSYQIKNKFAAAIRISIPPYPSEIKGFHPEDIPIEGIDLDDIESFSKDYFLYDCCLNRHDSLVTAGINGFCCVPISSGGTIQEAFERLGERLKKIQIPNMMYRTDIEKRTVERYNILDRQGWLR
jgi:phosphoribosylamine--glycine ligase